MMTAADKANRLGRRATLNSLEGRKLAQVIEPKV